jgi:hypothetical protein
LLVFFWGYYCHPELECESSFNDIQVLDIAEMIWVDKDAIRVEGPLPNPRFSHTASLIRSDMFVFGGENVVTDRGINTHLNYNDIWMVNLDDPSGLHWEELHPKGTPPLARHGHTMNALNDFLIIFGGEDDRKEMLNDVIVLDTQKREWY